MPYNKKMKKSKVIIRPKSKKSKVIIFFYPIKSIKKPLLSRLFSFALPHKPRKHPQTISIRLEHVLGMPLHGADETLARHFYGFDETVVGFGHGDQILAKVFDGLVMQRVHFEGVFA